MIDDYTEADTFKIIVALQKAPFSVKHPKHSHPYLQTTLFTPSPPQTPLNVLT